METEIVEKSVENHVEKYMTNDEFLKLSLELDHFHAVFYRLWLIGKPIFTEEISTACISFDRMKHGQAISFLFNPKFWDSINEETRKFVICHEMLHIILNHGYRIQNISDLDMGICNAALDVVVNHSLIRSFGFNRESLDWIGEEGCWTDTVFPGKDIYDNENYEYYFNLLKKEQKDSGGASCKISGIVIDDHSQLAGNEAEINEVIEKLNSSLSDEEKNSLKEFIKKNYESDKEGGSRAGTGGWMFIDVGKVNKKRKWEEVIKKWSKKFLNKDCYDFEQWARRNRRIFGLGGDLLLPSEMEEDKPKEDMIEVFFFQDVSGSCIHLKERFLRAAKSLPEDRFKVRAFSFDTAVHEVDLVTGRIYGGGGTSFRILEDKIQEIMRKEGCSYPLACFVITDGYGDYIKPQIPKNWYWFLTTNSRYCMPKECNFFDLKDYE